MRNRPGPLKYRCENCGLRYIKFGEAEWICVFCCNTFDKGVDHILVKEE